jgi:(1->4)-alpha-D-glucan 1-alpha-D-glucosylmutase
MTNEETKGAILSTYRLQFHKGFSFTEGARLADYLSNLGISHVYASPILTARAGSLHGYHVVDYGQINPELGGEQAFREMASALSVRGIGLILDIVPNHVAVGGDDNAMWLDLLKHGQASRYAAWFDVDFHSRDAFIRGKVHAPFLGEPLRRAIADRKLTIVSDPPRDGFALRYGEHLFPIRPEDTSVIHRQGVAALQEPEPMRALVDRQNYRLDYWRNASDRLNWRRFFEVTQLAGIRMENPAAFEAAHRIAFSLYGEGLIQGLRIDHVDGLADPAAYCGKVRQRLRDLGKNGQPAWLLVEKILAPNERLPAEWQVDGTTGYDFMDQVSALQHAQAAAAPLGRHWSLISGRSPSFGDEEHGARREVLEKGFEGQRELLVSRLLSVAESTGDGEDLTRGAVRRAVIALLANLRTYRTYATGAAAPEDCGAFFADALKLALQEPLADVLALEFVAAVMAGTAGATAPGRPEVIRRFNQLSSPLAARAVEDTTFYRYGRLLSRNDVGFDAGCMSLPPARFRALMQERAEILPRSMLALATHDHKRGADARARLAVISQIPEAWQAATTDWFELNRNVRPAGLDAGDEYVFYQMLTGSWPLDDDPCRGDSDYADRMVAWWIKGLREAKLHTSWTGTNPHYEAKAEAFARAILNAERSPEFLGSLQEFVGRIAPAGALNGLIQLIIQCTAPGIPDTYQGTELWDFSGVDPDNRRSVDFGHRQAGPDSAPWQALREAWRDGAIKQRVLQELLCLRKRHPTLFLEGGYTPLQVTGSQKDAVLAYARTSAERSLIVVVPNLAMAALKAGSLQSQPLWWHDTTVEMPGAAKRWPALFGGPDSGNRLSVGAAFTPLPFWIALSDP